MAGISRKKGLLAFGKQSGAGVPNTSPAWTVPIVSGGVGIVRESDELQVTSQNTGHRVRAIKNAHLEGDITILAHEDVLPFLLYHAMGDLTTTGVGDPYTHELVMADTIPTVGMTVYSLVGDSWEQYIDTRIQKAVISGASGEQITIALTLQAGSMSSDVAAPTFSEEDVEPRYKFMTSVLKAKAVGASPTVKTNIESFEVTIDRNLEVIYGTCLTPSLMVPERIVETSMTMRYDDASEGWDYYLNSISGDTSSPATPSQDVALGSFDVTFGRHPAGGGHSFQIQSGDGSTGADCWDYDVARPTADPGGGSLSMDAAGRCVTDATGTTELTVTVVNGTAGTAYE